MRQVHVTLSATSQLPASATEPRKRINAFYNTIGNLKGFKEKVAYETEAVLILGLKLCI